MESKLDVRLGLCHLPWAVDMSDRARFLPFLDEAAELGVDGVLCFEVTVAPWLDRPAEFRALLAERGLALAGVILRVGLDFAATERLAAWMAEVPSDILTMTGRCGTEAEWGLVLPVLERHGELAARHGVRAYYHHNGNNVARTMAQTERLLAETDPRFVGGMLDVGHATKDFSDGDATLFYRRNHARIGYVEFKDYSPATDLNTEVGRGICDWTGLVAALREHGYQGWIVVEQNGTDRSPRDASAESIAATRRILGLS
jgi:sugar phosphate isomerase/epimerase